MASKINRLSDRAARIAKRPGLLPDGRGLHLQIGPTGTKSWLFRYMLNGRERYMGLGGYPAVSLAQARAKRDAARNLLAAKVDPIEHRNLQQEAAQAEAARERGKGMTFREVASAFIEAHGPGWRNVKHRLQWAATLVTYAYPTIGNLPVAAVDTTAILGVLSPIWAEKPETASRVRQRIEAILDAAKAQGFRTGENPARWRGGLAALLPPKRRVRKVRHHAAVPHAELPALFPLIRAKETTGARALAFTILTATRSGEVRLATWDEIDLGAKLWRIPGDRTKSARPLRVPLSAEAVAVLREQAKATPVERWLFPGDRPHKPLSDAAMRRALREDFGRPEAVHGFRSTFRDWCAERGVSHEVAEAALSHAPADATVAAYQRSDLLDQRRRLADAWARHCVGGIVKVAPIRAGWRR